MARFASATAAAVLATSGCAIASPLQQTTAESPPVIFDTRADPAFGDATIPLQVYLERVEPVPRGPQHFCIVGYRFPNGRKHARVHWREGRRLILWEGVSDSAYARDAIATARRDLDLAEIADATEAEIASSTYLESRAEIDRVLADCSAGGTTYLIAR